MAVTNTALIKSALHAALAEGFYDDVVTKTKQLYYFMGRTLPWINDLTPPLPVNSYQYELAVRNSIITLSEVNPSDVCLIIPRIDWKQGAVYDQYDDSYGSSLIGINLKAGGTGYVTPPAVYIGSTGSVVFVPTEAVTVGALLTDGAGNYWTVTTSGTLGASAPTTSVPGTNVTSGTAVLTGVSIYDGGGTGATATATVMNGNVVGISLTNAGQGYTTTPTVIIVGSLGSGASASAVTGVSATGAMSLETSQYYVLTDEFNVYKCLANNNGAPSTFKPIGTSVDPMVAPDGYLWRYMYTVPIALRTKFLTQTAIPCTDALTDQFYNNGSLNTIKLDSLGSGYTSGSISVVGDGYLASDPVYLTGVTIKTPGSNYVTPHVTIDFPVTNTSIWTPSSEVLLGSKITYGENVYNVAVSGVTGTLAPTHRAGSVSNGTAVLDYVGTAPVGTLTVGAGGIIQAITLLGMVRGVTMVTSGSGYTSAPQITISGDGTGAAAEAVMSFGSVVRVSVSDPGVGYSSAPTIVIGNEWVASTAVSIGDQLSSNGNLYTVTVPGTTGTTAPSVSSGSFTDGTATLTFAGIAATATSVLKYGSGYSTSPSITISDPGGGVAATAYITSVKSEAILVPIFYRSTMGTAWSASASYTQGQVIYYGNNLYSVRQSGTTSATIPPTHTSGVEYNGTALLYYYSTIGQLYAVQVEDAGVGYTQASLQVIGDGTGAVIEPQLSAGQLDTLQANNELLTVSGLLIQAPIVSQGWGYGAATVTITGDGTGAAAEAIVQGGAVTGVTFTNQGSGYTWASITINGNGFGAIARAIIGPYGGHGKYPTKELPTTSVSIYSNISSQSNQGFAVNNDYRQVGLLRNPTGFGSTVPTQAPTASACWVLGAATDPGLFPPDSMLTVPSNGRRFVVVTNTGSSLLVQSLDNYQPVIGDLMSNTSSNTFAISAVTPPTVDKYSGQMLYVDNKSSFTPTPQQSVILRTTLTF